MVTAKVVGYQVRVAYDSTSIQPDDRGWRRRERTVSIGQEDYSYEVARAKYVPEGAFGSITCTFITLVEAKGQRLDVEGFRKALPLGCNVDVIEFRCPWCGQKFWSNPNVPENKKEHSWDCTWWMDQQCEES